METKTLRFVHAANILLGNPYTGLAVEACRDCYWRFPEVLDSFFAYLEKEKVDLVLFSGNLTGRYLTSEDAQHLLKRLSAASCRFVIAPGTEDPYTPDSLYASERLPENVSVFECDGLTHFDFPELGTAVYGWATLGQRANSTPLAGARPADPTLINLVMGSCDPTARTLFTHVSEEDIAAFGADFGAFAHGTPTPIRTAGRTQYCYAGFLEGRNFEELGVGGFFRVDIKKDEDRTVVTPTFVPLSRHRYESVTLDITGVSDMNEVLDRVSGVVADLGFAEDTSLRVVLEGELHPSVVLRRHPEANKLFSLYSIDFVDHTLPTLHVEELERDMSVRGELYRTLRDRLKTGNLDERISVAQALRAGLAALESRDITTL